MASVPKEKDPEEALQPNLKAESGSKPKKKRNPLPILILGIVAVVAVVFISRYFVWASNHVSTDDATVSSDVINVAPQVSGTVLKVYVDENEQVKKGQLLVQLDDSSFKTAVAQAKANYDLALAQSVSATAQVGLTGNITSAQIVTAQGAVEQNQQATFGSMADVDRSRSAVLQAQAQASGAKAATKGAQANLAAAISNRQKAADTVRSSEAIVESAKSAVKSAEANQAAAQATYEKAQNDEQRAETLLAQGAISAQEADQAKAAFRVADAQRSSAQQQVQAAQSAVTQREAELATAQSQVKASDAAIDQARAQVQANADQERAAVQGVNQAQSQSQLALTNVKQSQARITQARGSLLQANTAPVQVQIQQSGAVQAQAKVDQAKAALDDAKIQLDRCRIYAPEDGRISNKTVETGALVTAGTPLMSEVPNELLWVTANFKETQLAHMKVGQAAEVDVDALPGHAFKAHVDSISAGTGSTWALLPPDNATGNFTKVVQRIPVKVTLDPDQSDLDRMRTGMSVTATVTTN